MVPLKDEPGQEGKTDKNGAKIRFSDDFAPIPFSMGEQDPSLMTPILGLHIRTESGSYTKAPRKERAVGHNPWVEALFCCPAGATELSPGFQPWESSTKRCALKGRQIERPNKTEAGVRCREAGGKTDKNGAKISLRMILLRRKGCRPQSLG